MPTRHSLLFSHIVLAAAVFALVLTAVPCRAQSAEAGFKDISRNIPEEAPKLRDSASQTVLKLAMQGYDAAIQMADYGYNGDAALVETTLFAGNEYRFQALGDANVDAIMLTVYDQEGNVIDPETGRPLAPGATKPQGIAYANVRPEWTGIYLMEVTLFCKSEDTGSNWALVSGYKVGN